MNFIHASDFHLGYAQYGLEERFRDFARAFQSVIKYAIDHKVEFILISGDLFHKRNINAPTYEQAYKVLFELKENSPSTRVYAIEGNHDLAYHQDGKSWLEILNSQGLLKLIKLKEANGVSLMGDFIELEDVRIFGVRYLGSNTTSTIPKIAEEIRKIRQINGEKYTILMMHFGMEGQTRYETAGEIPFNSLLPLKDVVNYLALGHYHMKYETDGWVFNPGSVEMVSMNEYGLSKGFYHVNNKGPELISPITRHVKRIKLDISSIQTPQELYSNIAVRIERETPILSGRSPLIELLLYGEMNFPKSDISIERIKEMLNGHFKPLFSEVKIIKTNSQYVLTEGDVRGQTREEIELRIFSDRIKLDGRYRENLSQIVNAMVEVKKMAAAGIEDSAIQKELRWCFEKIRTETLNDH
ncbi:MAG: DNA repair exonuclease [Candidatus Methanoperedens sp.]|nr:DNA repair exonuclease [Candidatus Methanoperedens sp.]MCE8424233.1 DNA repair exonuclease [Candidatus Methanoperedens sp.]MCE8427692.1 DNA repair exonuclease [Candidatus Methanoperedens sp.]